MTFANSDTVFSPFRRLPHSRAALALPYVISDFQTSGRVASFQQSKLDTTLGSDAEPAYFTELLKNKDALKAWTDYTNVNNDFPKKFANGTAPLNGFRRYWIQDCIYLQEYVKVRMEAIIGSGATVSPDELRKFAQTATIGLDYAAQFQDDGEQKLGIPSDAFVDGWKNKSTQLKNSIAFYTQVAAGTPPGISGTANPWVDIQFALLPCIKGYYTIATNLLKDPTIVKNTLFYTLWISGNTDGSFAKDYDDSLTKATQGIDPSDPRWKRWREIFTKACGLESDFLTLATNNYGPYNILKADNTTYTISPYSDQTKYLDAKNGEVTLTTTAAKWTFKNGTDGYTIQNATTNQYLTFAANPAGTAPPYYKVEVAAAAKEWPINPISANDKDGNVLQSAFQLFALGNLEFVLDVSKTDSKVFLANNYQGTSQTWVVTKV